MTELGKRILAEHAEREELLLLHQEALIEQDLPAALARYEAFHACMRAHIAFENSELLPRHAQLAGPRWRTQVYALEHDKILELAEKLHQRLRQAVAGTAGEGAAAAWPAPARRRWIIQLLDDERTLKNVLEHHEEREEKGMLPELGLLPAS